MKSKLLFTSLGLAVATVLALSQVNYADGPSRQPKSKRAEPTRQGSVERVPVNAPIVETAVVATPLGTPCIACDTSSATTVGLEFCAGEGGAPSGFSIQSMLCDNFDNYSGATDATGWPLDATQYCKASFSGNPGCSIYDLLNGDCMDPNTTPSCVSNSGSGSGFAMLFGNLDDDECGVGTHDQADQPGQCPLACGECWIFRAFSHNPSGDNTRTRSAFTGPPHLRCSTDACPGGCNFSQGFWKTHPEAWPILSCTDGGKGCATPGVGMCIGGTCYGAAALLDNLNTPPASGNAVTILSHQLITAKINLANGCGADCFDKDYPLDNPNGLSVTAALASGQALLGGYGIGGTCTGSCPDRNAMLKAAATLQGWNLDPECHGNEP